MTTQSKLTSGNSDHEQSVILVFKYLYLSPHKAVDNICLINFSHSLKINGIFHVHYGQQALERIDGNHPNNPHDLRLKSRPHKICEVLPRMKSAYWNRHPHKTFRDHLS